ncbi:DUF1707 SHOCT-like domain-containing protein [Herbiconiux ginsengi]|uniref:DUF1707 domain-containing protein n=1 Tax=Herbiconiux ginsengi TaxID=381665 RepID=A0A1H3LYR7_9MICO|nr:DUF1707 domain-containing protein [Herbiconiux ginsengi]SDY69473.1 protein of unknown function [Herbiconiux ginsengi]
MSDYTDPTTASQRLSNADRDTAVSALARALADGRITADEFTERSASAKTAVTRGDLAPLFADLPDPAIQSIPAAATAPDPDLQPPTAFREQLYDPNGVRRGGSSRQPLGGTLGRVIVSLSPFVALALFFLCGYLIPDGFRWSWIFFVLIPVAGIIVYGAGSRRDDSR